MPEAPPTAEGWFVLHDFRSVDWDAWRGATERDRETALAEGQAYLERAATGDDGGDGAAGEDGGESAVFAILGHDADLLVLHFRPTMAALDRATRQFEQTAFAGYTEPRASYVSVTEVSGYVSQAYFEGGAEVEEGTRRYIEGKLEPDIPDGYASFYPMSKRRHPDANWYELSFEERAELMAEHGETGRDHAGDIRQVISSSVGFDDYEWGVTLFSDDPTAIKDVVYDMRFDEASSRYAEFGPFFVGRRFPPADLPAYMAGETVPAGGETGADADDGTAHPHGDASDASGGDHAHGSDHAGDDAGGPPDGVRSELADLDVYAGQPHGEDVHARVVYSAADPDDLAEAAGDLRESFDHYDTHEGTHVYESEGAPAAVVSLWETASAADTAAGFLADLPGVEDDAGQIAAPPSHGGEDASEGENASEDEDGGPDEEGDGWGTMGMFYTVKPEHREAFVERFGDVRAALDDTEGHRHTDLLVNREDENDMFIASRWRSREDAMAFFRSDAFRETVSWGRDVLADRPRHVFLE